MMYTAPRTAAPGLTAAPPTWADSAVGIIAATAPGDRQLAKALEPPWAEPSDRLDKAASAAVVPSAAGRRCRTSRPRIRRHRHTWLRRQTASAWSTVPRGGEAQQRLARIVSPGRAHRACPRRTGTPLVCAGERTPRTSYPILDAVCSIRGTAELRVGSQNRRLWRAGICRVKMRGGRMQGAFGRRTDAANPPRRRRCRGVHTRSGIRRRSA